jgi:hypothetical protein
MPWKHHFAGPSEEKRWKIEQIFDVDGLPHPILVNENGQIIAAGREDFRKESLAQRLERVFDRN